MENVMNILLQKREEEINLTKEEQLKILEENKIYLDDIINKIDNEDIQSELLRYEEQQNKLNTAYTELFYTQGFKDAQILFH